MFAGFPKAFDTIDFNILTQKVSQTHFVQIDSSCSSILYSNFGVPQGSILDPVPFNLGIADMEDCAYQTLSVYNMLMILYLLKLSSQRFKMCSINTEKEVSRFPADTDVFKTSSGSLKRSRRLTTKPDPVKTSGKTRWIYDVLKTSYLRRLGDVQFTTS